MAVYYLEDSSGEKCLYCTTTMYAFGPIFYEDDDVEDFLAWIPGDPRKYSFKELDDKYYEWKKQRDKEDENES